MASFVKHGESILEPGCGPAILADFLPKNCRYLGFDTNKQFVAYAAKKSPHVYLGNVLDKKNYKNTNVVIACDILHHLPLNKRKTFITNCLSSAKRLFIICDPWKKEKEKVGLFSSFIKKLSEWSEQDGTSNFKAEYILTREELVSQIESGFGVIPRQVKRGLHFLGHDIITIFYLKNTLL